MHDTSTITKEAFFEQALLPATAPVPPLVYLRDLMIELVSRDMKIMYKRSALGIAWAFLTPLLQFLVFSFFFRTVLSMNVAHYMSFAFTGLLVWTWTQSSLVQSVRSIVSNRALIQQPGFPPAIIPAATVTTWLIHFLLTAPVLLVVFWRDGVVASPFLLLLPLLVLIHFTFNLSLAYPLAALSVPFQDTQHILTVLLNLAFHLTPIFYAVSIVPGRYQWVYELNPMRHIIDAYRAVLIQGTCPNWQSLSILCAVTICLLPLGFFFFKKESLHFAEEL